MCPHFLRPEKRGQKRPLFLKPSQAPVSAMEAAWATGPDHVHSGFAARAVADERPPCAGSDAFLPSLFWPSPRVPLALHCACFGIPLTFPVSVLGSRKNGMVRLAIVPSGLKRFAGGCG